MPQSGRSFRLAREGSPARRAEGTSWPTCHPVQQEQKISVWSGKPLRCWDSLSAQELPHTYPGPLPVPVTGGFGSVWRTRGRIKLQRTGAALLTSPANFPEPVLLSPCSQLEGWRWEGRGRGCSRTSAHRARPRLTGRSAWRNSRPALDC